jgi:cyclopropane-fatty-acyl-phospholipid synthase
VVERAGLGESGHVVCLRPLQDNAEPNIMVELNSVPVAEPRRPHRSKRSYKLESFLTGALSDFPWQVVITDWTDHTYQVGGQEEHWCGDDLRVRIKTEAAGNDLLRLDGVRFLERFLEHDVDFEGNLYILSNVRSSSSLRLNPLRVAGGFFKHVAFQSKSRASGNVKSHYDIPQEALNVYLDRKYMSYSCGMFEDPDRLDIEELKRVGQGEEDDFDSLEKSMWRKFKDAADYIAPSPGETLLDVGCGYGGQLIVALENHPFGKVVGWTHSHNQATEGAQMLSGFEPGRWELNEGDYREDERVYDHITSTGMISHVGPRGLVPYVRNVRRRIKTGGRYLHHALMTAYKRLPIDMNVGIAFNKKYVWPGFHWFTVGEHVRALEKNGFQVEGVVNLTRHYAKTTTAWYERMMEHREEMVGSLGEPTFRAWQVFLAGITGSYLNRDIHVYRLYCVAT